MTERASAIGFDARSTVTLALASFAGAIAFGWPELASGLTEGDGIDIVARVVSRRFGGFESLQLEIRDAAPSGYAPAAGEAERTGPALEPGIAAAVT